MTATCSKSLAEIAESVRYGYTASATDQPVGPRFLRITDIVPPQIDWDDVPYCKIDESALSRYLLEPGDIVIARTGATVGYAKLIRNEHLAVFASYLVRIRIDPDKADPRYVGRIVESRYYRQFVLSRVGGAAQPNANAKVLSSFCLPIPSRDAQLRTVELLSAYDDLIENNTRRIKLLEEAAWLLYDEWFVRLRFPGHEHTPIHEGVPEGWSKRALEEIASIVMGQSPKSTYYNEEGEGLPFHQGVTDFGFRFPSRRIYCTVKNRLAEAGDILFSVRAPVGRINLAPERLIVGRGVSAIRSTFDSQNWLFYALKSHFFKEDLIGGGAIFAAITKKDLHQVSLLCPKDQLVRQFMDFVVPVDRQILTLERANVQLTHARDLLLPRLMSREVVV